MQSASIGLSLDLSSLKQNSLNMVLSALCVVGLAAPGHFTFQKLRRLLAASEARDPIVLERYVVDGKALRWGRIVAWMFILGS